ncbi:MAG: hypothetical protein GY941_20670 [Planctomycetes bacterium]|nr:hypothetical protein [Planctomycetota bacterium]
MLLEEPENFDISHNGEEGNQFSLYKIITVLCRNKIKIMLVFIVIAAAATVITLRKPAVYESQAELLVKQGREKISWERSMLGLSSDVTMNKAGRGDLATELTILTSGPVLTKVVDAIGPEEFIANSVKDNTPQQILQDIALFKVVENLSVGSDDGRGISLGFQAHDPHLAQKVLDNVIDFYMDRRIEVFRDKEASRILSEKTKAAYSELEQKEEEFKQFRSKWGIVSMDAQRASLLEQISSLTTKMDDINLQMSAAQSNAALIEKRLQAKDTAMSENAVVVSIKQRLLDLRLREAELENKYKFEFKELSDLRKVISFAESELLNAQKENKGLANSLDLEKFGLDEAVQALVAQKQFLKKTLVERKAELVKFTDYETTLLRLQRQVESARIQYSQYRSNYAIAKSSAALDAGKVSNIVIIQPPTFSTDPIDSKKKKGLALGIVLGLVCGVGVAYVREFLDNTIKTNDDVEKHLGLPVLASIRQMDLQLKQ